MKTPLEFTKHLSTMAATSAVLALGVLATAPGASASVIVPIAVTGFNQDVVLSNTATSTANLAPGGFDGLGDQLYEAGQPTHPAGGLPTNGLINANISNINTSFQLQSYAGNNVVQVTSPSNSAVLNVAHPSALTQLAVLAGTGTFYGGSIGTLVLTFTNGLNVTTDYSAAPIYFPSAASGTTTDGNAWNVAFNSQGYYSGANGRIVSLTNAPDLYETRINLQDLNGVNYSGLALSSLRFYDVANALPNSVTDIFAVSGSPSGAFSSVSTPEPTAFMLMVGAGLLGLMRRRTRRAYATVAHKIVG